MRGVEFRYRCPKCGWTSVSDSPDLEECPIPWDENGHATVGSPICGGDIGDWGPSVDWWMIPKDIQALIMERQPK